MTEKAGKLTERLGAWWDDFFFSPLGPTRLAVCRIVYYLALYWLFFIRESILNPNLLSMVPLPEEFFFPQNVWRVIPIASNATLDTLTTVLKIALLLGAAGVLTRVTSAIVFALMFYLMSVPSMYGKLILIYAIPVVVTGILAMSRCGDVLSVDRLVKNRLKWWPLVTDAPEPSGVYRWPIQAACVYLVMAFFLAGLSKLFISGPAWGWSDNLSILFKTSMQNQGCIPVGAKLPKLAAWFADLGTLTRLMAIGVMCIELGSPLALVRHWTRYLALAAMAGSTLGFYYLVGPDAWPILAVFVFFIPFENLRARRTPA